MTPTTSRTTPRRAQRPDVRLGLKEVGRQLVRQNIAVPGIPAREALSQGKFTFSLQVAVGSIEVVEPCVQKGIHHAARLGGVHLAVLHGQAHKAKSKVFLDVFHIHTPLFFTAAHSG